MRLIGKKQAISSSSSSSSGISNTNETMEKILIINPGESLEASILRVDKRVSLTLRPGPGCLATGTLRTNYPLKKGTKFERSKYCELPLASDHQEMLSSAMNWHVTLKLELAGTFHFTFAEGQWQAYVIVNPEIKHPIDQIRCQTVLSKNLGPFKEWRKRLTLSKELKYNMIHLTPIQELGSSNSAYALRNHHKVSPSFKATLDEIKKEVEFMEKKWCMLSVTDVVLNHVADDCEWIRDHPECGYNVANSPHLRPAFLLDCAFMWLAKDMLSGTLKPTDGLGARVQSELDLQSIGVLLKTFYVPQLKIYELFMVNVNAALSQFDKSQLARGSQLQVDYGSYERNQAKVTCVPEAIRTRDELKRLLEGENLRKRQEMKALLEYACDNALNAIRYERLNPAGAYFQQLISDQKPLVAPYFSHSTSILEFKIAQEERLMYDPQAGAQFFAHNGWVMGAATVHDFAAPSSQVYLKRELIAWGDCIKLRYGQDAKQVPYLWEYMRRYVEAQAKVFHGFRIDNCHSTPLHVAEFVVDVARAVRPDIYIMAELFTSSEATDNNYVNRLGLTSLIRESMSAHDARELGRLMYRYGGTPVGAFHQHGQELLRPSVAHAIFYDQTHDNESPIVRRSAYDVPATTAILNMANCATGSTRGYDELVPHHINVVSEERLYTPLESDEELSGGIMPLRRVLNGQLQRELASGFEEIFVDQVNDEVLAITRHNPVDGRSIVLIARTAFYKNVAAAAACPMKALPIEGHISRLLFEAQAYGDPEKWSRSEQFINGLQAFKTKIFNSNVGPQECKLAKLVQLSEARAEIQLNEFTFLPSSVLALEICLSSGQSQALALLNKWQVQLERFELTLSDVNYILFRCAQEDELEPYELPGLCKFTYCGLYGLMYHLEKVRENQDQAHPLAMNLRQGGWLANYIVDRLKRRPTTAQLADHLELALHHVEHLPRGMVPKYFDLIITKVYQSLLELTYTRMSVFVSKGPRLVKLLALSSVALIGECQSAPMPHVEHTKLGYLPSLAAGLPHFASGYMRNWGRDTFIAFRGLLLITGRFVEAKALLLSYARTLKHGLIPNLLDGGAKSRYNCRDAIWWWLFSVREYTKMAPNGQEILRCKLKRIHKPEVAPASQQTMANGANGGGGTSPPSTNGTTPLTNGQQQRKRSVAQMAANGLSDMQPLADVIQEAMECHFRGTQFVEENAGKQLDEHMRAEGFEISFGVNRDTGFVYGGNRYNCGTWMDKMGSSEKAKTRGLPATPRDGSAVEIVGLSKAVVSWLDEMYKNGRAYPYDGVECLYDNTITLKWAWKKWASQIQANFERYFYIPLESTTGPPQDPHPDMINKRGIYKDTLGSSLAWQDYQLRPNFLVAMVVAPELFDKEHARQALALVKEHLVGPLGMRTLDPSDWNYCGDYDNANDSEDAKLAHGYNYHSGPEWLWLTGYYIRASSKFLGQSERSANLKTLANFYSTLVSSPWLGLPELTNTDGKPCPHSCDIQAWSLGTALEALHESVRG